MKVAAGQIAPVFLDRDATISKVVSTVEDAAQRGAALVAFGEALVPGYPVWLERMDGARFDNGDLKDLHALYLEQAVSVEDGHLEQVQAAAERHGVCVVLGTVERPADRGGHSLYCSRVFVDRAGRVASVHRKLVPTYEERLCWGNGDAHGLVTHPVGEFTVGALNCWENWMPLARAALYARGCDLQIMLWPGTDRNTKEITRFVAMESRAYVMSASSILRAQDIPSGVPCRDQFVRDGDLLRNGGSAVAGPDGEWLVHPLVGVEQLIVADLDRREVLRERQNFDPAGHSARPDTLRLRVDAARQRIIEETGSTRNTGRGDAS